MEFVTADWGGTEGICAEFREIQKQINSLDNPTDPHQVIGLNIGSSLEVLHKLVRHMLILDLSAGTCARALVAAGGHSPLCDCSRT